MPLYKHADLCCDLDILRRLGDSAVAIRLVFLPTGRIPHHLFLRLHVAELLQSAVLHLSALFWIRRARHRFDFLLLRHLLFYPAVSQRDDAIDHEQR